MTGNVRRIFVEKKPGFAVEAQHLLNDLKTTLGVEGLTGVRIIHRYDIAGVTEEEYTQARDTIFSEATVDYVYEEEIQFTNKDKVFAMEYLPGQYDQRADSAAQCVQLLTQKERPDILTAKVIVLQGEISAEEFTQIKDYCINPIEAREADLAKPDKLSIDTEVPADVKSLTNFINLTPAELTELRDDYGLAMSDADLLFCQQYFKDEEKRDPTITELRLIDTYWSDHCRHTTFSTKLETIDWEDHVYNQPIQEAYQTYLAGRNSVYGDRQKDVTLMDIAVMAMRQLRQAGKLSDLDESEEINACSIVVPVDIDGQTEDWLVMFKNETHNHPTEIEPFGGAATCLGGAIRDPLSGRSYVYQAMRVTGSADPRTAIEATLTGKLPQKKITTGAAAGYSSYGNQIGLATGQVTEVYHPDFVAKRMEIGAVIGAAPKENVIRSIPVPGDAVILVGGRTGRDGCGGATGSSKEHTEESLTACGAEVQKGNPPTERKLQRLFRHEQASKMIKRCNDFGAGGVSVAIGELTDGVLINLDAVSKKYEGLDGTELAISESQERMAVVVAAENAAAFCELADLENLEAVVVAKVTDDRRLIMNWRNQTIVNLSRDFLDTNGIKQTAKVFVKAPSTSEPEITCKFAKESSLKDKWLLNLQDLNVCSQRGLVERFDSSIGAGTVLMPFGGKYQATPAEGMAAKIPVLHGEVSVATLMTYGYNPNIATWSPFHGAVYAVIEAVTKIAALGGDYTGIRLTLQEYFEKLTDEASWGKPFSALLGAYYAQTKLGIPAIGGKDSMSGTFKDIKVPPTLVAFAVSTLAATKVISQEFKAYNSQVIVLPVKQDAFKLPDFDQMQNNFKRVHTLAQQGVTLAAHTVKAGGIAAAVSKMCFGNRIGFKAAATFDLDWFTPLYGAIILEIDAKADIQQLFANTEYIVLGRTMDQPSITIGDTVISLTEAGDAWERPLESIFPTKTLVPQEQITEDLYEVCSKARAAVSYAKPKVLIPVFPGTNCEYDSARAFEKAGGCVDVKIFRNLTARHVEQSVDTLVAAIKQSQIIMFPGGFSAGDEPDGSGKFIATVFRNPKIKEAVTEFLDQRDGLILGVCNGFQALIKLGLVPYGKIVDITEECPTLTFNNIGRHMSRMVITKVTSNLSPWLYKVEVGDVHSVAVSHGEGRFVAPTSFIDQLAASGQIATQYVDLDGKPTYNIEYNPNGSMRAVEGITSPDGRVFGKMAHSERIGESVAKNIHGDKDQHIFESGIAYFR